MILRHKNRELLRYEWTAMGGIRLLSVAESARRWLPLEFGEASAPGNEQALAGRLASWLNHRIFDNGFGLFALADLDVDDPDDAFAVLQGHLRGKHPALFERWLGFPQVQREDLTKAVERLKGFRFRVHPHYNLPRERLALLERFLQKRVSDILQYGFYADDYLDVREGPVGVKNKIKRPDVGVKCDDLDACALQMIWNMKANPNITARELADVLGVEQRTIERRIRVLREKGIVRRVGVDKTGHWEVLLEF